MKLTHYALILFSAFGAHQVKAQTNPGQMRLSWGGSTGHLFTVNAMPYQTQISREAIASSPDWQFENSPPVDFATAAKTARRQLKELVEDEASWQVDEISLCRVTSAPEKWYYRITFAKPVQGQAPKTIPFLVDFSGNSGKVWIEKSLVTIWMNMSYDDALGAIRLCDGVQIGPAPVIGGPATDQALSGVIWSFDGYDAIIALWADKGRVSRMTYWTRKDFESSETTRAAAGQSIRGVKFFTTEKKVSINTNKQ